MDPDDVEMDNDDQAHDKFLDSVRSINAPTKKKSVSTEVGDSSFRECSAAINNDHRLHAYELTKLNVSNKGSKSFKKALRSFDKQVKPIKKSEKNKIYKKAAVEKSVKELEFWQPYVEARRSATSISFLPERDDVDMNSGVTPTLTDTILTTKTPLEQTIADLIMSKRTNHEQSNVILPSEEKSRYIKLESLEKVKQANASLARMNAYMLQETRKNRRIRRQKGRHFRLLHRKQKEKRQIKEVMMHDFTDALQDDIEADPDVEKDDDVERKKLENRVKERFTQKHNKKTKMIARLAKSKRNTQVRQILTDRLDIARQLTRKTVSQNDESEDEAVESVLQTKKQETVERRDRRALEVFKNATKNATNQKQTESCSIFFDGSDWTKASATEVTSPDTSLAEENKRSALVISEQSHQAMLEIEDDADMAEDSVLVKCFFKERKEMFEEEKKKAERIEDPKTQSVPGWNKWAGPTGKKSNTRKRRAVTTRFVKQDNNTPAHVIFGPKVDDAIKKHKVKALPFPFQSIVDYEETLKQPLGKEWNAETAFNRLNRPRTLTRSGQIIEPVRRIT